MRYMLMMNAPRGTGDYLINSWSPDDFQAHLAFMHSFHRERTESGELVGGEGLATPGAAARTTSIPERDDLTMKAARLAAGAVDEGGKG